MTDQDQFLSVSHFQWLVYQRWYIVQTYLINAEIPKSYGIPNSAGIRIFEQMVSGIFVAPCIAKPDIIALFQKSQWDRAIPFLGHPPIRGIQEPMEELSHAFGRLVGSKICIFWINSEQFQNIVILSYCLIGLIAQTLVLADQSVESPIARVALLVRILLTKITKILSQPIFIHRSVIGS
jgi:hypothetical protein